MSKPLIELLIQHDALVEEIKESVKEAPSQRDRSDKCLFVIRQLERAIAEIEQYA